MTRLAALAVVWVATAAVTLPGAGRTLGLRALLLVLATAALVAGVRWRWAQATTLAVGTLVASYGVGVVLRETVDERAPLVAAGVTAVVLLASWGSEPATTPTDPAADPWRARAATVAGAAMAALALAGVVLVISSTATSRSLWLQMAGAAVVVAAVGMLAAVSRRAGAR